MLHCIIRANLNFWRGGWLGGGGGGLEYCGGLKVSSKYHSPLESWDPKESFEMQPQHCMSMFTIY